MKLNTAAMAALPLLGLAASSTALRLPSLPDSATSTATVTLTVHPSYSYSSASIGGTSTSTITSTLSPSSITFGPTPTSCDLRYCANGTSYCQYWGGYTSFDVSLRRPVPGETFTAFALCSPSSSSNSSNSETDSFMTSKRTTAVSPTPDSNK